MINKYAHTTIALALKLPVFQQPELSILGINPVNDIRTPCVNIDSMLHLTESWVMALALLAAVICQELQLVPTRHQADSLQCVTRILVVCLLWFS